MNIKRNTQQVVIDDKRNPVIFKVTSINDRIKKFALTFAKTFK